MHDNISPVFVLIRPQMGENIGAAARAMWNFSLDRMSIVSPRDGWPNTRAVAMASGAGRVLDAAQIVETTAMAVEDSDYVYATTARPRDLVKPVLTPEAAMIDAKMRSDAGQKVAVLFGPERAGMENDDIARANVIVSVPVNPEFSSLNLAQSVLLMSYEWSKAQGLERSIEKLPETASHAEIEALSSRFDHELEKTGFFHPPEKATHMRINLRNLWSRLPLSRGDVQIFHGILRQLTRSRSGD